MVRGSFFLLYGLSLTLLIGAEIASRAGPRRVQTVAVQAAPNPDSPPGCPADVNGDGTVDAVDVQAVATWWQRAGFPAGAERADGGTPPALLRARRRTPLTAPVALPGRLAIVTN